MTPILVVSGFESSVAAADRVQEIILRSRKFVAVDDECVHTSQARGSFSLKFAQLTFERLGEDACFLQAMLKNIFGVITIPQMLW